MPPCYRSKFRGGFSIRKITSSASLYIEQRSTTLQHDCSAISLAQFGVTGKDIGYCVGNDLISIDTGDFVLFQSSFPRGERPSSSTRIPFLSQFQSTFPRGERLQISTIFHLYICISSTNSHFSITSFCIFYLIHFFLICFFQLFMVRIFWGFSVYFWFALYRNNT